jgi:hypothetical protein
MQNASLGSCRLEIEAEGLEMDSTIGEAPAP